MTPCIKVCATFSFRATSLTCSHWTAWNVVQVVPSFYFLPTLFLIHFSFFQKGLCFLASGYALSIRLTNLLFRSLEQHSSKNLCISLFQRNKAFFTKSNRTIIDFFKTPILRFMDVWTVILTSASRRPISLCSNNNNCIIQRWYFFLYFSFQSCRLQLYLPPVFGKICSSYRISNWVSGGIRTEITQPPSWNTREKVSGKDSVSCWKQTDSGRHIYCVYSYSSWMDGNQIQNVA